jgi:hypothetical protein
MTERRVMHGIRSLGLAAVWLGLAVLGGGCGSGAEQTICDKAGNCEVCDAYGCSAATPSSQGSFCGVGEETCKDGQQCIDGLCLNPCEYSSECGPGRICSNSKCVVGCDASTPCPTGYKCNGKGTCAPDVANPQCSASNLCVGGLKCVSGICTGGCTKTSECAPGEICDTSTSSCITDPQPKPPCAADPSVCPASQTCKNGYCRYPCADSDTCNKIDVRIAVCKEGICMSDAEANPKCTKKEDCASNQDCVSNVCL